MIPKGCKRLAEVDFPIAVVSKHAAREKSIRHGHPSTRMLQAEVNLSVVIDARVAGSLEADLRQTLEDLGLSSQIRIERT